ncbi:PHP domain-like protein [Tothia fuscella]|uniref:PHP domain-like protein n=1 Tax=Tothia fuscella TaxID=1048955 RepID=A0A9P4P1V4_9PEZI|nr:PHP domain-like protein [Tothia fuscella]
MYYDLNLLWSPKALELQRNISFLAELGYNVIALNHIQSGKLPADISCPIPATLPFPLPPNVQILRRSTLVVTDTSQNHRIKDFNDASSGYDILAIRPTDEKSFQQACWSLDCDLISLDLTLRYPFHFKHKVLLDAVNRGVRIELCYGPGITSMDKTARKQLIENATAIIRATRGRGIVISSEATSALQCRAPTDIVNLATVWGLGQERGVEALTREARSVVVAAQFKRTSYRGVVDVIYGGEKPIKEKVDKKEKGKQKRKAAEITVDTEANSELEKPLSKTQLKKQAHLARMKAKAEAEALEIETTQNADADVNMAGQETPEI